ncbi:MAG TPA: TetR/AcrR family transcriptional regulator [Solirubrobacteraceae bacterium]|nr:TetR/AcrR family transcriptional regulator [Solirubrobacteraceae bacterium]
MPVPHRLPAAERRATIERAAEQLFAERGYAGARIEDIVEAAGVTKPVLYRHFASKQALHRALLERHRAALAEAALDEYLAGGPLEERLPAMLDAWFGYVERHPYAWRMLLRETTGDPELGALHRDLQARQRAADAALLRETLPHLTDEQIEPLAEVVRCSLTGLALWWLDHPEIERPILVATMLDVVIGILERHRSPAAG